MKIMMTFIFQFIFQFLVFSQNEDTISIIKINYLEKNIPAGWSKYLLEINDTITFYESVEFDTLTKNAIIINYSKKHNELFKSFFKEKKKKYITKLDINNIGYVNIYSFKVVCNYRYLNDKKKNSIMIENVISVNECRLTLRQFEEIQNTILLFIRE